VWLHKRGTAPTKPFRGGHHGFNDRLNQLHKTIHEEHKAYCDQHLFIGAYRLCGGLHGWATRRLLRW
jgi:hypothetical protein